MDVTIIIVDQNEIKVIVTRNYEMVSYVNGYHVYKKLCNPLIGEFLWCEWEPDNPVDKYAVCVKKENKIVGHFHLENLVNLRKQYFISLEQMKSAHVK